MKNVLSTTVGACALFVLAGCAAEQQAGSPDPRMQLAAARVVMDEGCTPPPNRLDGLRYEVSSNTGTMPYRVPDGAIDSCGRLAFSISEGAAAVPHDGLTPGRTIAPGYRFAHRVRIGDILRNTQCEVGAEPATITVPAGTFSGLSVITCNDQRADRPLGRRVVTHIDPTTRLIVQREATWGGSQPGSSSMKLLEAPAALRQRPTS